MTMQILKETITRREYKTKWQALTRAKQAGLNIDLIDRFYATMLNKGYDRPTAIECILYAAKNGVFGMLNTWER